MSEIIDFMDGLLDDTMQNLNTCTLCKIERYDPVKMKADVIPLVKIKEKDGSITEPEKLIEVPVSLIKAGPFYIRPPYKKGDIVIVIFADSDIENVLFTGEKELPNRKEMHGLDNAMVLSGIVPFNKELTAQHANDLLITNESLTTKVVLKENGDIHIKGNNVFVEGNTFLGDPAALEGVPLGDTLKAWLDGHTHPGTGSPTSASPAPSQVVKTI